MKSIFRWGLAALMVGAIAGCGGGGGGVATPTVTPPSTPTSGVVAITAEATTLASTASVETCSTCHGSGSNVGPVAKSGFDHQSEYNKYTSSQSGTLTLTIDSISSVLNGAGPTYTSTMTFTAKKSGVGLTAAEIVALSQKTFYASTYDSTTRKFDKSFSYSAGSTLANYTATGTPGQFTIKSTTASFAPEASGTSGAQAYAYLTSDPLDTEGMTLYANVVNASKAYGDVATYTSAANVTGCEKCHGTPYMKHGYRAGTVAGVSDFSICKNCHYDTRTGGHQDWQLLKDDPARYAELDALAKAAAAVSDTAHDSIRENMTAAELTKYAYLAKVMNDVHMAHNMEFPYPASMQNCETCHSGKLTTASTGVLDDSKFVAETCISCHAPDGLAAKMKKKTSTGAAITIHDSFVAKIQDGTDRSTNCQACHSVAAGFAPTIGQIHNGGYNPLIYADATGTRYSTGVTVTIDKASVAANVLTIDFSAATTIAGVDVTKITPTVLIGMYGYGTKDFIVAAHGRDIDTDRNLEYVVGATHKRFKTVTAAGGKWQVTADLSPWAAMIADKTIKRVEISVLPQLKNNVGSTKTGLTASNTVGLNAPSKTFDLTTNAFDAGFYGDIVKVATSGATGCNSCHDQLATTFHNGTRGGNIRVCRTCHEPSNGGSHLEMQSRSIDSYVHAIHSFQAFDPGDINFADPVAALEYAHHIEHVFPNFTIKNCEACHNAGKYGVPDPSKSLPGLLSASDTNATWGRAIGTVPSYVTGPASRACGSCHRAQMINEDDAGGLATFNSHVKTFGYLYENVPTLWNAVVEKVMAPFK